MIHILVVAEVIVDLVSNSSIARQVNTKQYVWRICLYTSGHTRQFSINMHMLSFLLVDLSLVEGETDCIYLCGSSLGLQPKETSELVTQELVKWQKM